MKHALAVALVAVGVAVHAQDRITVPRGPAPGQTVRSRVTQDMTMTIEPAEPGAGAPSSGPGTAVPAIPPMTMAMRMVIAQTMTVGPLDDQRKYRATIAIEDATADMTMNGSPMPMPGGLPLARGQLFTIQYDESRNVSDVSGADAAAVDMFRKMVEGAMRQLPATPIGIGETVAVPIALPMPALPTGPLGELNGEATMTLRSVATEAGARLATFDSKFNATVGSPSNASGPMNLEIRFSGGGTMVYDLDRGIPKTTDQQGTIDGTMSMPGGAMPAMKMHGTIKSSSANQ